MMTPLLRAIALAALAALAGLVAGYLLGEDAGMNRLRADWAAQQLRQSADFAGQLKARADEIDALRRQQRERDATYEQSILTLQRRADGLLDSLRQRAERAAAVPAAGGASAAAQGCTGAQLYRDDAAFLVRLAERADQLRAALERCQGGDAEPVIDGTRMDQ